MQFNFLKSKDKKRRATLPLIQGKKHQAKG